MLKQRIPKVQYSTYRTGTVSFLRDTPGEYTIGFNNVHNYVSSIEKIASDDDIRKKRLIKPCIHTKWETVQYPTVTYGVFSSRMDFYYGQANVYNNGAIPPVIPFHNWVPDIDTMIDEALGKLLPEFNGLTFLLEPLDFGSLLKKGKLNYEGIPYVDVTSPESAVLSTNLSVLPYVSDLTALWKNIFSWEKSLENVKSAFAKGVRVVRSRNFHDTGSITDRGFRVDFDIKQKYTYGAWVTGKLPPGYGNGVLDRYGLKPNLSTLWELLPFSFLIDYFAPIGSVLDKGHAIEDIEVPNAWFTRKIEGTIRIYTGSTRPVPYSEGNYVNYGFRWSGVESADKPYLIQTIKIKQYLRDPFQWDLSDGVKVKEVLKPLGNRQMANIGALASQFARQNAAKGLKKALRKRS